MDTVLAFRWRIYGSTATIALFSTALIQVGIAAWVK